MASPQRLRKKDGKDVEVQEGWKGRVLPFDPVQRTHHKEELDALREKETRLSEIAAALEEIIESLSETEGEYVVLNDANDKFAVTELNNELKEHLSAVETDETRALNDYLVLLDAGAKKRQKEAFVAEHAEVYWPQIETNKDGTYGKGKVNSYLTNLQSSFEFPEDTLAPKLLKASSLLDEEKALNTAVKEDAAALHLKTKELRQQTGHRPIRARRPRHQIARSRDDEDRELRPV